MRKFPFVICGLALLFLFSNGATNEADARLFGRSGFVRRVVTFPVRLVAKIIRRGAAGDCGAEGGQGVAQDAPQWEQPQRAPGPRLMPTE